MKNKISFSIQKVNKKDKIVEEINLIKKEKFIPEINKTCKLHKTKHRLVKTAHFEKAKCILFVYGQYKYFDEVENKMKYFTEKLPNVSGKRRHDNITILKSVEPVLQSEMTIQYAAKQARDLFNLTTVPSTIWNWIGIIDVDEKSYQHMEEEVLNKFSGHINVDEVYDNKNGIIIITDPVEDTILSTTVIEKEITNVEIETEFNNLKDKGIELDTCTRDGSGLYVNTIKKVFPFVRLQICIFHLIKMLLKYFIDWQRNIRDGINTKDFPRGSKSNGKKLKQILFHNRNLFVKKRLTQKERIFIKAIIESYPEYREIRYIFLKFMRIFSVKSTHEAIKRFWDFICEPLVNEKMPGLVKQFMKYFNKNELFTYLIYDIGIRKKIRTSNHVERINRKFRKKQKTHYRIRNNERKRKLYFIVCAI